MNRLTATLVPGGWTTRLLATRGGDDCLRAELPSRPLHPRAVTDLLEALASWCGTPLTAAVAADALHPGTIERLFGGALVPEDTALVRFHLARLERPRRLRGPGDFRDVYRLHGRAL